MKRLVNAPRYWVSGTESSQGPPNFPVLNLREYSEALGLSVAITKTTFIAGRAKYGDRHL